MGELRCPFSKTGRVREWAIAKTKRIPIGWPSGLATFARAFGCVRGARRARERLLTTAALLPHCLLPRWLAMSDTLWCDTGPECGTPYDPADRQYTNRGCCFDVCVDAQGKPQQRKSFKDRLSL